MTRIYCTVGISVYFNCMKWMASMSEETENASLVKSAWSRINDKRTIQKGDWNVIDAAANRYLFQYEQPNKSCAEVQSLEKIFTSAPWDNEEKFILYFICTNTEKSIHAGKVLLNYFLTKSNIHEKSKTTTVEGLQVESGAKLHAEGLQGLAEFIITTSRKTVNPLGSKITPASIINVTAGYKGVVPMLTLLGQLKGIPLVYIYEKMNELIILPALPLAIDSSLAEAYFYFFSTIRSQDDLRDAKNGQLDVTEFSAESIFFLEANMLNVGLLSKIGTTTYQRTYLGILVEQHLQDKLANTSSSFGKGVELMFYEYFMNEPVVISGQKCLWVEHSYKNKNIEIDFRFFKNRTSKNCLGIAEVKSSKRIHYSKFGKQLERQLKFIKVDKNISSYYLFLYGVQMTALPEETKSALRGIKEKVEKQDLIFKSFFTKLTLSVKEQEINRSFYERFYEKKFTRNLRKHQTNSNFQKPYFLVEPIDLN